VIGIVAGSNGDHIGGAAGRAYGVGIGAIVARGHADDDASLHGGLTRFAEGVCAIAGAHGAQGQADHLGALIDGPLHPRHHVAHHSLAIGAQYLGRIDGGSWSHAAICCAAGGAGPRRDAGAMRSMAVAISQALAGKVGHAADASLKVEMAGVDARIHDGDAHVLAREPLVPQARDLDAGGRLVEVGMDGQVGIDFDHLGVLLQGADGLGCGVHVHKGPQAIVIAFRHAAHRPGAAHHTTRGHITHDDGQRRLAGGLRQLAHDGARQLGGLVTFHRIHLPSPARGDPLPAARPREGSGAAARPHPCNGRPGIA